MPSPSAAIAFLRHVVVAGLMLTMLPTSAAAAGNSVDEGAPRFHVDAELRAIAVSVDHRYSLQGEARYVPSKSSTDGRYLLTSVNTPQGGCSSSTEVIFANGFE